MATTPVFLPGEFHGQKSLMGYSPWGLKELDMTERLTHTHFSISSLISPWNGLVHLGILCASLVCFPHQIREVFSQYFLK